MTRWARLAFRRPDTITAGCHAPPTANRSSVPGASRGHRGASRIGTSALSRNRASGAVILSWTQLTITVALHTYRMARSSNDQPGAGSRDPCDEGLGDRLSVLLSGRRRGEAAADESVAHQKEALDGQSARGTEPAIGPDYNGQDMVRQQNG